MNSVKDLFFWLDLRNYNALVLLVRQFRFSMRGQDRFRTALSHGGRISSAVQGELIRKDSLHSGWC
ncbi:hypothetical protein GcM1_042005 [Golovinomyces cichoracearum]|uniref:Uncharacterized protein n=1 Tax=Golovinomyces cichoracearum TaxID=62708 RepID=A0A420JCG3_9PEZI|nr:hypothetical protein GcM1_042005 [Golovinomyces cichoracearum]